MSRAAMYRGRTVLFARLLLLVIAASSEDAKTEEDVAGEEQDAVVTLTEENFQQLVKQHDRVLVNYYAHWHGKCKQLASQYEEAAKALKQKGLQTVMAKIDVVLYRNGPFVKEHELIEAHEETLWPLLWYYHNGKRKMQYTGERTAAAIADWLARKEAPRIAEIQEDDADSFLHDIGVDAFAVIARVKPKSARDKAYRKMVEDFLPGDEFAKIRFASIPLPKGADPKSDATLSMWRPAFEELDSVQINYESTWSARDMSRWVLKGIYPSVGNGFSSQGKYGMDAREKLGIDATVVALLADEHGGAEDGSEELRFQMLELLAPLTQAHDQWRFTTANIGALSDDDLTALGVVRESESLICVLQGKRRYILEGKDVILQANAVEKFLANVKAKKARAAYMSAAPPKKLVDKDGITVLTGRTFEEHVLNPQKDVFVNFYEHGNLLCRDLVPEWKRLAERVQKEGWHKQGVIIAQINGTENEFPEEIKSYPLLVLYPAGKVERKYRYKLKYEDIRQYDKMVSFVINNAKNLQDVDDIEDQKYKKKRRKYHSFAEKELEKRKRAMDL